MSGIFTKIWHKDKKLFVILISGLVSLVLWAVLALSDEPKNSVFPIIIFAVMVLLLTKRKKRSGSSKGGIRRGWTEDQKESVRNRQGGVCNKCGKHPPRWEYHHRDGNRSNNNLSNCEGLCPNCHSVKTHD